MAPKWKRALKRTGIVLAVLLVVGLVTSYFVAGTLIAASPRSVRVPTDIPVEPFTVPSKSGSTLAGWHVPGRPGRGVVVLVHGIRGTRASMLPRARILWRNGYSTVLVDLQAHGESRGERITLGHFERHDVRAAVKHARSLHPDEPIAVLGVSLGGASAVLASPLEIDALVLESVFPTVERAIHNRVEHQLGPWLGWLPSKLLLVQLGPRLGVSPGELRPIDFVGGVGCPVFVMSGYDDEHTTREDTALLFAAAGEPKQLWCAPGIGHEDFLVRLGEEYSVRLIRFLDTHMKVNKR